MSPKHRVKQLETCSREMFGNLIVTPCTPMKKFETPVLKTIYADLGLCPLKEKHNMSSNPLSSNDPKRFETVAKDIEKQKTFLLIQQLLVEIYGFTGSDYNSATSSYRSQDKGYFDFGSLKAKDCKGLSSIIGYLKQHVDRIGASLIRQLKRRDALRRQQDAHCDVISTELRKRGPPDSDEAMRFTINPVSGESGFAQWAAAMKMVAQLNGGIPAEFRRRLWLTLANKHLSARGVNWVLVEKNCFSEWSHPDDSELGVQIVKDLHRTGCSLFCGEDGQENQALLKRVLLAYARWNKAVGYCQGFNMLAALILQVTEKSETDALKLMIYLIEGVLPDSYFADNLRGLSVDMAVFRELLRSRLPRLSKHLDTLQTASKEGTTSYEPPLTNVFTMQWFLTLFCNCLPHATVLRVWDLILLEGNEILLRTALAIWQTLSDKILEVKSADEFYCLMGMLTRELLEFDLLDANTLIKGIVNIGSLTELKSLREHYMYNITPWGSLPVYYNEMEKQLKVYPKEKLILDISALKKQYVKLKQRQKQAHIIFSAAISRQSPPSTPVAMNHLLLGRSALVPAKRLGPPKGSIPPVRQPPSTLSWKDVKPTSSSSSSDTELCDDPSSTSSSDDGENLNDNPEVLMPSDNTQTNSQINDNASACDNSNEIEKYLHHITDNENDDEDGDDKADKSNCRRNSERALQIIQENSLILHRIMQCQSRLSPPSPIHSENKDECSDYESKYSSILEKSKSLNERYNSLILNLPTTSADDPSEFIQVENIDPAILKVDDFKYFTPSFKWQSNDNNPVTDGVLHSRRKDQTDLEVDELREDYKHFDPPFKVQSVEDTQKAEDSQLTDNEPAFPQSPIKHSDYFEHLDPLSPNFDCSVSNSFVLRKDESENRDYLSGLSLSALTVKIMQPEDHTSPEKVTRSLNQNEPKSESTQATNRDFSSKPSTSKTADNPSSSTFQKDFEYNFESRIYKDLTKPSWYEKIDPGESETKGAEPSKTVDQDFVKEIDFLNKFSIPASQDPKSPLTFDENHLCRSSQLKDNPSFKTCSSSEKEQIDESQSLETNDEEFGKDVDLLGKFSTYINTRPSSESIGSPLTSESRPEYSFESSDYASLTKLTWLDEEIKQCEPDTTTKDQEFTTDPNFLSHLSSTTISPLFPEKGVDSVQSDTDLIEEKRFSQEKYSISSLNTVRTTESESVNHASQLFERSAEELSGVQSSSEESGHERLSLRLLKLLNIDEPCRSGTAQDLETIASTITESDKAPIKTYQFKTESTFPYLASTYEEACKETSGSTLFEGVKICPGKEVSPLTYPSTSKGYSLDTLSPRDAKESSLESPMCSSSINYYSDSDRKVTPLRSPETDKTDNTSPLKLKNPDEFLSKPFSENAQNGASSNEITPVGMNTRRSLHLDLDEKARSRDSSKSPNKVFNPFPVTLNTRQNKEVGLKLGLYKK